MKSTREERGTHSVIAFIQESRKHRLSQSCKSVVPGEQGREKWWRVFCFTSCCCEEEFISSHSLQPIMQGHQDRDTRKEFKAGTEAETPEEPCSLACSHGLSSYLFILPGLQRIGPSISIINQENAPQTWPQVSRREAVLQLRFLLHRHVMLTTKKSSQRTMGCGGIWGAHGDSSIGIHFPQRQTVYFEQL